MGTPILRSPTEAFSRDEFRVFDDFNHFTDADLWTVLDADATSVVAHQGAGRGYLSVLTSADNEEAAVVTTNELFLFAAGKPLIGEGRVTFTVPNTDDASFAFGFADAIGANQITDNGGALAINDSGVFLYTLKDSLAWRFGSAVAGGAVSNSVSTTNVSGTQTLRIEVQPISSTEAEARPFVDGKQLQDSNGVPIRHTIAFASATDMDFGVYVKGHNAADASALVDYLYAAQTR